MKIVSSIRTVEVTQTEVARALRTNLALEGSTEWKELQALADVFAKAQEIEWKPHAGGTLVLTVKEG